MCLDRGTRPTPEEFERRVNQQNYRNLCIWQSIGADVEHGFWAIYGARLGTYMIMLEGWDYREVQDFDVLARLWESFKTDSADQCTSVGDILRNRLSLPIIDLDPEASAFFKQHYNYMFKNKGIMARE